MKYFFFIFLDLPKLHSVSFNGNNTLAGDKQENNQTTTHGHSSTTLVMRSRLGCRMDNDDIDLPSLTNIRCNRQNNGIFNTITHVVLESMIVLC